MSIKFALICECNSKFEGWFPTNEDYENQLAKGQLLCPMCDSTKVRKDIMSPSIKKKSTKTPRQRGKENILNMTIMERLRSSSRSQAARPNVKDRMII